MTPWIFKLTPRKEPMPFALSWHMIKDWIACPTRFALRYLAMLRPESILGASDAMTFGTIVHACLASINQPDGSWTGLVLEATRRYQDFVPLKPNHDYESCLRLCALYMQMFPERGGISEQPYTLDTGEDFVHGVPLHFTGTPDLIQPLGDAHTLVDFKTTARYSDNQEYAWRRSGQFLMYQAIVPLPLRRIEVRALVTTATPSIKSYHWQASEENIRYFYNQMLSHVRDIRIAIKHNNYPRICASCVGLYGQKCPYDIFCWGTLTKSQISTTFERIPDDEYKILPYTLDL